MGENWTMSIFYPILSGKKWASFFCIFTKQLSNRVFFLYWKTWEIIEFSQKVKFCSNSQSGIENFKVCINCWLFTPLDYKLLIVVSRKISLWYLLYLMVQWCCSQELIRQGYILKSFLNLQIKPAFLVFFACMSNTHKFCDA